MARVKPGSAAMRQRRINALENLRAHANSPHADNPGQLDRHKEEIKKLEEITK
jgi:hypothetical protein